MRLFCCGQEWDFDDPATPYRHYCPPGTHFTMLRVEKRRERVEPFVCRCTRPDGRPLLGKHRHTQPWDCLPADEVEAWRQAVGCGPQVARHLYWVALEFGG